MKKVITIDFDDIINLVSCDASEEVMQQMNEISCVNSHLKRPISHHEATIDNPRDYYQGVIDVDGKTIKRRAKTKQKLYEELYSLLDDELKYIFNEVFERALAYKTDTEPVKLETLRHYRSDYENLVKSEWANVDIRNVTSSDIRAFYKRWAKENRPLETRFLDMKSVFNLVFSYATSPEINLVDVNPVPLKISSYRIYFTSGKSLPEEKAMRPEDAERLRQQCWADVKRRYSPSSYAILWAIETGMRVGELCALKVADVNLAKKSVHIHSQQIRENGEHIDVPYTKAEAHAKSRNGRKIPLTPRMIEIYDSIMEYRDKHNIVSPYLFCQGDGAWVLKGSIIDTLARKCKKIGIYEAKTVHSIRMYYNSYVLIPMGVPATERARLLGHSVETNLRRYSFSMGDEYNDELLAMFETQNETLWNPNVVDFRKRQTNKKARRTAILQAF